MISKKYIENREGWDITGTMTLDCHLKIMESKKKKIGYGQKIKYVYFVKIDGEKMPCI